MGTLYKMAKDRVSMPSSIAGITRYFDEVKSKVEFSPGSVIVMGVVIMIVVILMHLYAGNLLGI